MSFLPVSDERLAEIRRWVESLPAAVPWPGAREEIARCLGELEDRRFRMGEKIDRHGLTETRKRS